MDKLSVTQYKIIYLFMNANGICTKEECSKLCTYADISVDEAVKKEIEEYVQTFELVDNNDNSSAIIAAIGDLLRFTNGKNRGVFGFSDVSRLNRDKIKQACTLWVLIKLAYYYNDYSNPEQKIIEYLIDQWKFDKNLYYTMIDTIETELALLDKCNWLRNTDKNRNSMRRSTMIAQIEKDLQRLQVNIKAEINEADI